jgi:hypothetical protein
MNIADFGPGWWVCCRLPDGREAIADGENPAHAPVLKAIRRVNQAIVSNRDRADRYPGSARDYALIAAWLDETEPLPDGQLFTREVVA